MDNDDLHTIPLLGQLAGINPDPRTYFEAENVDVDDYDRIVVCMSGGKDSWACLLHLIDIGTPLHKIELWHHLVDGYREGRLVDWPFMDDYIRKLAQTMKLPVYFSWLSGGFKGELLKQNARSRPHKVETPSGLLTLERSRCKESTRMKFPQQGADLSTRWCSSSLKIDIGRRALNAQERFHKSRTLFITGERREESPNRAKYNQFEPHACDRRSGKLGRLVDTWRPVLHWEEDRVWDALRRHDILPPVPYRLGWSRSSCMTCVFNSPKIWATLSTFRLKDVIAINDLEQQLGCTISRSKKTVLELASGEVPIPIDDKAALKQAKNSVYFLPIKTVVQGAWKLPLGAFSNEKSGAT